MDEIFHVPQAQHYCRGEFRVWDPKLTTPPGLYLISIVPVYVASALGLGDGASHCSAAYLRTTNWVLGLLLFWTISSLVRRLNPSLSPAAAALATTALSLLPVSFFLHHMYYTDTGSLLFVLLSYALSLRHRHWLAGLSGLAALLFRQTNVVWIAFIGFSAALRELHRRRGIAGRSDALLGSVLQLLRWALQFDRHTLPIILAMLAPYLLVVAAFGLFLYVNQGIGIVLGDKSHHEAGLHIPQAFYFVSYTMGMSAPVFLCITSPLKFVGAALGRPANFAVGLLLCVSMGIAVKNFTVEHPFLLSDNRHYPFYVWKNLFRRHWLARYTVTPLYLYAFWAVNRALGQRSSALWRLALALCTAAVLIPSPLLEFRYFTVPYAFVRLNTAPTSARAIAAEAAWFAAINATTIWVFLNKPFAWDSEPGQLQRFMW
ncbi:glucosyltransferase [Dipsacomyces acuminosporus]|nr:glucosyltransferase [Dipsacomyces acuminosporus]